MLNKLSILSILVLTFAITSSACQRINMVPFLPIKDTGDIKGSPLPQGEVTLQGPSCPESFKESQNINERVKVRVQSLLTLRVGSTPSIPCSWASPNIKHPETIKQINHYSKWPAEGVTPMPGAPGKEIWVFKTMKVGKSRITMPCHCLDEEGVEEQLEGTFEIEVHILK